jgi:mannose-6-phosphate isomerase-like protein (cupin superfamily)
MTPSIAVLPEWEAGAAARLRASTMLLMRIERWDVRRDGPLSLPALQQKLQALGYDAAARLYPPGAVIAADIDPLERAQAVGHGLVKVRIDGESAILTAGDIVFVPSGAVRRVEVIGSAPAHCFDAVRTGEPPRRNA